MRRFVVALPLVAMAACSKFTSDDAVAEGGTDTGRDGGVAVTDDAARADGPPLDAGAGNDGSGTLCTSFAAEPFDDGWRRAVSGGSFAPDGNLFVEASPAAAGFGAAVFGVPPQGWSDLELAVADTVVAVTFAGQTKTVTLDSSAPYRNAVGCALTVGATAKANVTQTTVRAEKACLQNL